MRLAILAITGLMMGTGLAFAAGEGTSTDADPAKHECKKGEVWDKKLEKCIKAQSGILPDEQLYEQGRALAKAGEYDWAVEVLAAVKDQSDPRVLNYTGYSHRKAGRFELGFSFYRKALAINPDFVLAREYLGEGYVASGRVDLARLELAEIGKRCGVSCEEYQDLAENIATAIN